MCQMVLAAAAAAPPAAAAATVMGLLPLLLVVVGLHHYSAVGSSTRPSRPSIAERRSVGVDVGERLHQSKTKN